MTNQEIAEALIPTRPPDGWRIDHGALGATPVSAYTVKINAFKTPNHDRVLIMEFVDGALVGLPGSHLHVSLSARGGPPTDADWARVERDFLTGKPVQTVERDAGLGARMKAALGLTSLVQHRFYAYQDPDEVAH